MREIRYETGKGDVVTLGLAKKVVRHPKVACP